MYFDKKILRQHYGKLYFRCMYYGLAFALLFLQLTYYPTYFGMNVSTTYITFTTMMIVVMCVCMGVGGYLYYDTLRQSKSRYLWMDAGKIYYQEDKKELISGRAHTYLYYVKKIDSVMIDDRYFIIDGLIQVKDEMKNRVETSMITELYIPRCFNNEEELLKHVKTKIKISAEGRVKKWWKK